MQIKTILVHLANDDQHKTRVDVALRLAKQHNAHIVALFITFPVGMPPAVAGRAASAGYIAAAQESARRTAAELEEVFKQACERDNISYAWVMEDASHLDALQYHAHAADLTIVSRSAPGEYFEDRFRLRLTEEFVLVSGSPVLVLPRVAEVAPFGKHIMVAWHANREAVRAIRDSLGSLMAADEVTVVSVGRTPEERMSEAEVVAYLRRHGVTARPMNVDEDGSVGEKLLATANDIGADMMVMGAYGHSRLREIVFGGVTRHVLGHSELPVLMSH